MKSLLVVEAYSHPKVLENQFFLFRDKFDMTFMTIPDKYESYQAMMPNILKSGRLLLSFHSTSLFAQLLLIGYKYDYIHISTGPEHAHFSNLWTRPFYFLCMIFYRRKMLLTIKNSRSYLKSASCFPSLLNISLRFAKLVLFETDTLRNYFVKAYGKPLRTAVIYDRYTDLLDPSLIKPRKATQPFRIGMLGSLDKARRDYQTVLDAFRELPQECLGSVEIVILGECIDGEDNEILKSFKQLVAVDYPVRYLTSDEFDKKGSSCDLLLSPLLPSMEYGTFKGSGAIGDAIYLQKNILLPSFVDPDKEFSEISYYYSNKTDLAGILNSISQKPARAIGTDFIEKYNTDSISRNIINEINQIN